MSEGRSVRCDREPCFQKITISFCTRSNSNQTDTTRFVDEKKKTRPKLKTQRYTDSLSERDE